MHPRSPSPRPILRHHHSEPTSTIHSTHDTHVTIAQMDSNSNSNSTNSSSSNRRNAPSSFPLWLRLSRLIFGKIRRLPKSMSTTLVLFTVHMYLTVPVIIVCGVTGDLKTLLRPFRHIKAQGFLFEELGEQYVELF
uniref:Transmembrane protein n=1 Tax=Panagrellus redivivus TaxID=6233 RepID=A0A7E4VD54_PANRE